MFPLHEDTIALLALIGLAAICAVLALRRGRPSRRITALILGAGAVWPWPIALYLGFDHYYISAAAYLCLWTLLAIVLGVGWGKVAGRLARGAAALVLALLPAITGAGFLLERQRVPDAPCAERGWFRVGDLSLSLPRDLGVRSVYDGTQPEPAWSGAYSAWVGDKPSVRAYCAASNGGRDVLELHHLWLSAARLGRRFRASCGTPFTDSHRAECEALARTKLSVVQLYARPDGMPGPTLGLFDAQAVTRALSAGVSAGYRCPAEREESRPRFCTIWFRPSPQVLSVSTAWLGPRRAGEDPVHDARQVLAVLLPELAIPETAAVDVADAVAGNR